MHSYSQQIKIHDHYTRQHATDPGFSAGHQQQIHFLQHERLAHLAVTLFSLFWLFSFFTVYYVTGVLLFLGLFSIALILSVFYIFHYFKLENTLHRWNSIYQESIIKKMNSKGTKTSENDKKKY